MNQISEKNVASVRLITLELSEDEVEVLAAALDHLLEENATTIEQMTGASVEEVRAISHDLSQLSEEPSAVTKQQPIAALR